jgi:FkbM family methyltransferase
MLSKILIGSYRFWHGRLHLKGAGLATRKLASFLPGLQRYRLELSEGHVVIVDFRDLSAFYWLNYLLDDDFEEKGLLKAISAHIRPHSVVWDVGANCGLLSYRIAKETKAKGIYFFEPNPTMFALAQSATRPFPGVQGLPCALSDHCGTATLTVPEGRSATGTLSVVESAVGRTMEIHCQTGDQLVKEGSVAAPQIIKIDTEGHEIAVMHGMREIISAALPTIFFEHLSLTDEEVVTLIPRGYEIFSVSDEDGSLTPGFDRSRGHNSVLKPRLQRDH